MVRNPRAQSIMDNIQLMKLRSNGVVFGQFNYEDGKQTFMAIPRLERTRN